MPQLNFRWGDVAPLIRHAEQATSFSFTMPERIDAVCERYGVGENDAFDLMRDDEVRDWLNRESGAPGLILVGDHGVYLMSAGLPRQIDPEGDGVVSVLAYAEGTNPQSHDEWDDNKRFLYGGDDGADKLPLEAFVNYEKTNRPAADHRLVIELSDTTIAILQPVK